MHTLNPLRIYLLAVVMTMLCFCLPHPAYAGDGLPTDFDNCAAAGGDSMAVTNFTSKAVYCVQNAFIRGVYSMLSTISYYMTDTVGAVFALAITMFAMRILTGTGELKNKGIAFFLRLGMVGAFSYNLGGLAGTIFNAEGQLLGLLTGTYSPWAELDYFISMLVGFAPGMNLSQGLLGIISASFFSTSFGIGVFLSGTMALFEVLGFISKSVTMYLRAIFNIGLGTILSALVVPAGVFRYGEKYITQLLSLVLSGMITPVMQFAVIYLFAGGLDSFIGDIFAALGTSCGIPPSVSNCGAIDFDPILRSNQPLFTWAPVNDPSFNSALTTVAQSMGSSGVTVPFEPALLNPFLRLGANINPATVPRIEFGSLAGDWTAMSELMVAFTALWIFASMMKSVMERIPAMADKMATTVSRANAH